MDDAGGAGVAGVAGGTEVNGDDGAAQAAWHSPVYGCHVHQPVRRVWPAPLDISGRAGGLCAWLGLAVGLCLAYMLTFVVVIYTLGLSQGFVGHATQMEGLVLLAQFAATVWAFLSSRRRRGSRADLRGYRDHLMMCWSRQAIVATYVVAGLTKQINSNGEWLGRSGNFVLSVLKSQSESYYSSGYHANPASMAFLSALNQWPFLASVVPCWWVVAGTGRFSGRMESSTGSVIGLMRIGFHVMLGTLMYLPFYESRNFVMLFLVNPLWWAWVIWRHVQGRFHSEGR